MGHEAVRRPPLVCGHGEAPEGGGILRFLGRGRRACHQRGPVTWCRGSLPAKAAQGHGYKGSIVSSAGVQFLCVSGFSDAVLEAAVRACRACLAAPSRVTPGQLLPRLTHWSGGAARSLRRVHTLRGFPFTITTRFMDQQIHIISISRASRPAAPQRLSSPGV